MQALRALADNAQLSKKHSKKYFYLIFPKAYLPSYSVCTTVVQLNYQ